MSLATFVLLELMYRLSSVMGPTGVGKSSVSCIVPVQDIQRFSQIQFIRDSAPSELCGDIKIGHSLQSETTRIPPISLVAKDGTRIKLVDTPGFDDSREGVSDAGILKMIAIFLAKE